MILKGSLHVCSPTSRSVPTTRSPPVLRSHVSQGRESEHNWNPREKAVIRVRGMLRGQAFQQFPDAFVSGLKSGFFEGLSKTVSVPQ